MSTRWMEFGERLWTMSECKAQTKHKHEPQVNGEQYV